MISAHLYVTIQTPAGAIRVLHQPIVNALLHAVADNEHPFIELSRRARWLIVDATVVDLKGKVRSVDGDADRSDSGDGLLQSCLVALGNVDEAGDPRL